MVQLIAYQTKDSLNAAKVFQFYYGSINSLFVGLIFRPLSLFQFYYGSINSIDVADEGDDLLLFQFYYGSINRMENNINYTPLYRISILLWFN